MPHKSMLSKEELSELARLRARILELERSSAGVRSGASGQDVRVSDDADLSTTDQARERLVGILETTSDLVATADSTTQLSYMNEAGRKLLGWSASESLQAKTLADMFPAWAAKIVVEAGVPAAVQFGVWQGDTAIIGADGTEIPVSQVLLAHRSRDGDLCYLSTIIRDIRERKQAEHALQAILAGTASVTGEAFFQSLAHQLSAALGVRYALVAELSEGGDATTLAVWAKDRFAKNFTYALSGTPCENVVVQGTCFYPTDVAALFPEDKLLAEMGVESYLGTPLRDAAGNTRGLLVVMDDSPIKEVTVAINVLTVFAARAGAELGRKQAEERLKLTQFAIDHSTDGACWIGSDARFHYVNDTFCRWLGYSRDELLQMSVHDVDPGFPESLWPAHWQKMRQQKSMTFESQLRSKSGDMLPVEITTDIQDFDGCEYACAFARDVTDRVEAEREKAQLQDQLHQAQKMEAIGQLAAGVAHDFNNILTVISAYTDLIHSKCSSESHLADWVGTIQRAIQQATGVTRSLLTFSHKLPAHKEPVDLCAVATEAVQMLERALPASIELVTDTSCTPAPVVNADATQLHQVILNLAVNARDSMPHGGTLSIAVLPPAREEPASTLPLGRRTPAARLVLRDTGVGMSPEVRSRIFEPFFTTKERGHGTGLGLAMIHGIVSEHGGWIDVETKPREGSAFTIHLPCVVSTKGGRKVQADADHAQGNGELIILAEDREEVREVVATALTSVGYEVLQAGDGASFLSLVRSRRDDLRLCVLDVDLPKKTGIECLSAIRSDGVNEPVIMITGNPDILANIEVDPDTKLLLKPFRMSDLQRLAGRLIAGGCRAPQ